MTAPTEPTNTNDIHGDGMRLTTGMEVLEQWSRTAKQVELNAMSDALFAILDRVVYHRYDVVDDPDMVSDLIVEIRDELAMRIRLHDVDTFGIVFIGSPADALIATEPAAEPTTEPAAIRSNNEELTSDPE